MFIAGQIEPDGGAKWKSQGISKVTHRQTYIAALKDMPLAWLKIEREHSPESTNTSMETRYNPGPDQIPGERPLRSKEILSEVKIK